MDELLTLPQVAKILGLAERTIYKWSQQGKIPAFKIGKSWRYRAAELDLWLETQRSDKADKGEQQRFLGPRINASIINEAEDNEAEDNHAEDNEAEDNEAEDNEAEDNHAEYNQYFRHAGLNSVEFDSVFNNIVLFNMPANMPEMFDDEFEAIQTYREDENANESSHARTGSYFMKRGSLPKLSKALRGRGKVPYRTSFEMFDSDRSRILEVLSDGYGRGLFDIANAIWEIDSESDSAYELIRKPLASTLSREVNRKPPNLFRWRRGLFSTRRYEKPQRAIKRAMKYDLIDLSRVFEAMTEGRGGSVIFPSNNEIWDAFSKLETSAIQRSGPSNPKVPKEPLDPTASEYFNNLIDVELLAVPVLGVESQLIRRRGKELIFHSEDLSTVSEELSGQKQLSESRTSLCVSSTGFQGWRSGAVGKTRFLYDPSSEVIEFLAANERLRKEITAVIAFRAFMYLLLDKKDGGALFQRNYHELS
jgi:excisionase family DNA binding protein